MVSIFHTLLKCQMVSILFIIIYRNDTGRPKEVIESLVCFAYRYYLLAYNPKQHLNTHSLYKDFFKKYASIKDQQAERQFSNSNDFQWQNPQILKLTCNIHQRHFQVLELFESEINYCYFLMQGLSLILHILYFLNRP